MAISSSNTKHTRSVSLPSRSHPLTQRVEEQLSKLGASSEAILSTSSSAITQNLKELSDLYDFVDDLLHLPVVQHAMAQEKQESWMEEVLEGSLKLLDTCGNARDLLSQMKENVQLLQSAFRRRSNEVGIVNDAINSYLSSRKKTNKGIKKCLQDLKKIDFSNHCCVLEKDPEVVATIRILREVEGITKTIFKSLLIFASGSNGRSTASGWSLISKLTQSKRILCEGAEQSEVVNADVAVNALLLQMCGKKFETVGVQNAQSRLEALELSINDVEDKLECVFRHLLNSRVSLLNSFNH